MLYTVHTQFFFQELRELNKAIRGTRRALDLSASPCLSPAKRVNLGPRAPSPIATRKPNALLQAMNSVASDRARSGPPNSGD